MTKLPFSITAGIRYNGYIPRYTVIPYKVQRYNLYQSYTIIPLKNNVL